MVSPALPMGNMPLENVVTGVADHCQDRNNNADGYVPTLTLVLVALVILRNNVLHAILLLLNSLSDKT